MPDDVTATPLIVFIQLSVVGASLLACGRAVSKLWRGKELIRHRYRNDRDPGGVIGLLLASQGLIETPPGLQGTSGKQLFGDLRLGISVFLVSFMPVMAVHIFLINFVSAYHHDLIDQAFKDQSSLKWLVLGSEAIVLAPVIEEFLFRNLLLGGAEVFENRLRRHGLVPESFPRGVAPILFSSLAFAGLHLGQGAAQIPLFLFALALGYTYFQTHRLLPAIIAHAALNSFTMIQLWALA